MDEVEFIARYLCALDGVHPDAKAMDAKWELWTTKTVKVLDESFAAPAWHFYAEKARLVLAGKRLFDENSTASKDEMAAIAVEAASYKPQMLVGYKAT